MLVYLSSHFRDYTAGKPSVVADGTTLAAVLADLDRRYPGLRFRAIDEQDRVRPHVKIYVNLDPVDDLEAPVRATDEVHVIGALSGG